jgi:hypothetical protein
MNGGGTVYEVAVIARGISKESSDLGTGGVDARRGLKKGTKKKARLGDGRERDGRDEKISLRLSFFLFWFSILLNFRGYLPAKRLGSLLLTGNEAGGWETIHLEPSTLSLLVDGQLLLV